MLQILLQKLEIRDNMTVSNDIHTRPVRVVPITQSTLMRSFSLLCAHFLEEMRKILTQLIRYAQKLENLSECSICFGRAKEEKTWMTKIKTDRGKKNERPSNSIIDKFPFYAVRKTSEIHDTSRLTRSTNQ